jgi:aryl-alcohol dehydrogenase-like predicted oxidoreductase
VTTAWLHSSELRVGLGCMRMSTDSARNEAQALETIAAAADAGITVFDTARAYGLDATDLGHNERLLARALRHRGAHATARVVTKGGMTRAGGGWIPDGRAGSILRDCEASLAALDGVPIDVYLLHAPDPRTPWTTSIRALARLLGEGMVRRVGVSNVNRAQLDQALDLVDVSAVQVAMSVFDDTAIRGGIVDRCAERGIACIAHSPLGGPRRARSLARREVLSDVARRHHATAAEVSLAWLLDRSPVVVAIPGARRPETARSCARAATLTLAADDLAAINRAFGTGVEVPRNAPHRPRGDADVVVVMGIPGSGKSRLAGDYTDRGYARLNRDDRGGSMRQLDDALDQALASGVRNVVLDNTFLTRAARSHVIETAHRHHVGIRCIWLDTPLAQAQVNLVERLIDRFGSLPSPDEMRMLARREAGLLTPTSQMRTLRELEPPSADEGFTAVDHVPFERSAIRDGRRPGLFVAAAAPGRPGWVPAFSEADGTSPCLIFDWDPDGSTSALDAALAQVLPGHTGPVEIGLCSHAAGPPVCWCRPPLPGLLLAFARAQGVDPSSSVLLGISPAHRTLAAALGAYYVAV